MFFGKLWNLNILWTFCESPKLTLQLRQAHPCNVRHRRILRDCLVERSASRRSAFGCHFCRGRGGRCWRPVPSKWRGRRNSSEEPISRSLRIWRGEQSDPKSFPKQVRGHFSWSPHCHYMFLRWVPEIDEASEYSRSVHQNQLTAKVQGKKLTNESSKSFRSPASSFNRLVVFLREHNFL